MLGTGEAGLIEVLDVPEHLRDIAPEGLAALSFLTDDFAGSQEAAKSHANDVTVFDAGVPGVDLFFCTMGGVPDRVHGCLRTGIRSCGDYSADTSDARNS